jgi:hypothetical protein
MGFADLPALIMAHPPWDRARPWRTRGRGLGSTGAPPAAILSTVASAISSRWPDSRALALLGLWLPALLLNGTSADTGAYPHQQPHD